MLNDSSSTNEKIFISVSRLPKLDNISRNELIEMMMKDARDERKH